MTLATSKNLTILGALTILGGLVNAALSFLQTKTFDVNVLLTTVASGFAMILAKGQANTGGTIPATDEASARVMSDAVIRAQTTKGFARLPLLLVLALAGCAGVSALQGSTGPITVTTTKDPVTGAVTPTSTVTITAGPSAKSGDSCWKPVSATFTTVAGGHDACSVTVPLKPNADGTCP